MANNNIILICALIILCAAIPSHSQENGCGQGCETLNDCPGQLICSSGKCNDDPDVGTHICSSGGGGGSPSPGTGSCMPSGQLKGTEPPSGNACNTDNGAECCTASGSYDIYDCSPPVSSATPATLTLNDFSQGGDGGGASSCEEKFYDNNELVVALSTGWFDNRNRCSKMIKISGNGKSVTARVVDECDSRHGCDEEHAYQPPCHNNIVDASARVWNAWGVPQDQQGDLSITWSPA